MNRKELLSGKVKPIKCIISSVKIQLVIFVVFIFGATAIFLADPPGTPKYFEVIVSTISLVSYITYPLGSLIIAVIYTVSIWKSTNYLPKNYRVLLCKIYSLLYLLFFISNTLSWTTGISLLRMVYPYPQDDYVISRIENGLVVTENLQDNPAMMATNKAVLEQDKNKKFILYQKAYDLNDTYANFNLAEAYEKGEVTVENIEKAIHLYKEGVEKQNKGSSFCAYALGRIYSQGNKVEKNSIQAKHYFIIAAQDPYTSLFLHNRVENIRKSIANDFAIFEISYFEHQNTKQKPPSDIVYKLHMHFTKKSHVL